VATRFDHEELDVYQVELQFVAWTDGLLKEMREHPDGAPRAVCDHLERASLSVLLNTAEGNGKRQGRLRGKFFDDARGSATECAACLDALVAKSLCAAERIREGKNMLLRIVAMLSRLVTRYSRPKGVRESDVDYELGEDEDEHEDENGDEDEDLHDHDDD